MNEQRSEVIFKGAEDQVKKEQPAREGHGTALPQKEFYYLPKSYFGPEPEHDQQMLESIQRRVTKMIKTLGNGS